MTTNHWEGNKKPEILGSFALTNAVQRSFTPYS
jgi:hypothetical protein